MSDEKDKGVLEIRARAEKLLTETFGGKVQLGEGEDLEGSGRSKVVRFKLLERPQTAPESVVVKQIVVEAADPKLLDEAMTRNYNDWAGLQFLSDVGGKASPAPQFYAGDREAGLIVLEDLGSGMQLNDLLLGNDPEAATQGLYQFSTTLGRMHALTIGKEAEFDRVYTSLKPRAKGPTLFGRDYEVLATIFQQTAKTMDMEISPQIEKELTALIASLNNPGPFLAYTHSDPCPDNCLLTDTGLKLVDFEFGEFRHALLDGVYGRILFPTCWCVSSLTDEIVLEMERCYRAELIKGCPEAADDKLFYRAVIEACACWALNTCRMDPIERLFEKDIEWGIASVRARIMTRFEVVANLSQQFGHLEALGTSFGVVATKLREVWSEEMPLYPAFRTL